MTILTPDERAHRAFVLELVQVLRLAPSGSFQEVALKTPLDGAAAEEILREGTEDDWCQLQRNMMERVQEVMQNLDVLARYAVARRSV